MRDQTAKNIRSVTQVHVVGTQIFNSLPENVPPGCGNFHVYIPEQPGGCNHPAIDLVLEGVPITVPIVFTQ